MTLRALIVDDEPPARRRLRSLLRAEAGVEVVGDAHDGPSAVETILRQQPDLVFLDVQMPGLDGFDVLEEVALRSETGCPAVIFVTAYDKFALKAFDAHAADYLLKPFDRARLHEAIERARRLSGGAAMQEHFAALVADATARRPLRRLVVQSGGRISFVPVEEIGWIEAADHYVSLHAGRATHLIRETISGLAARLDRERFVRVHRGALVNIDAIKELRPAFHGEFDVELKDGTRLRASRTYAQALSARLEID
jgi:two-component system LytT family response regulator